MFDRRQFVLVSLVTVATLAASLASSFAVADEIERRSTKTPLRGTITAENSTGITVKPSQTGKTGDVQVPIDDVAEVRYDGAAGLALRAAAGLERAGEYEKAADQYQKAAAAGGSEFVAQSIAFGQARAAAAAALATRERLDEAIRGLEDFRTKYPASRHHFALHELLGRLLLEKKNTAAARQAFAELDKATWPELKMRAANWDGRALVQEGKLDEAEAKFDIVAALPAKTPGEKIEQQQALLARCDCLVAQKKHDEAVATLRRIIQESPPEDAELQAAAWNNLGDVLRAADKPKDALLAYLRVDLLYSTERTAHAKALFVTAQLWDRLGRPADATASRDKLKRLYPNSPWAKLSSGDGSS